MTTHVPTTRPGPLAAHRGKPVCPTCAGSLTMTWHRPAGRLASKIVPFHRYRCQAPTCQWEGNCRIREPVRVVPTMAASAPTVIDAPTAGRTHLGAGARQSTRRWWLTIVGTLIAAFASIASWRSSLDEPAPVPRYAAAQPHLPMRSPDAVPARAGPREASARVAIGSPSHRPSR